MLDRNITNFLDDMKDAPKKYLRVKISGGKGIIALTDGNRMYIKKALIAEIHDNKPVFIYRYNADAQNDAEFNLVLAMKKTKLLLILLDINRQTTRDIFRVNQRNP